MSDDEDFWRRPPPGAPDPAPAEPEHVAGPVYGGPPPTVRPPAGGYAVPIVRPPAPPRTLPDQDHDAIDAVEERARAVTLGIGVVTGAVLLLLLVLVVVRAGSGTLG